MMTFSMLVDLTISLLEENKHLKADKEALIAGQETLQKTLAERLAEVDDLKKHLATLDLCEKSNDELRSALKKKDAELKAVRHYCNECLKDLKKAHAKIEILKKNPPQFILTDDESFASLTQKLPKLNPLVMSSDNASIVCIDADKIKAEAIKEFAERLKEKMVDMCYAEDAYIPYPFTFVDNLVKEMVGDAE